eukprot:8929043-Pyramimonas_sp.AAC.1
MAVGCAARRDVRTAAGPEHTVDRPNPIAATSGKAANIRCAKTPPMVGRRCGSRRCADVRCGWRVWAGVILAIAKRYGAARAGPWIDARAGPWINASKLTS